MNKIKEIIDDYFNIAALLLMIFLLSGILVLVYKKYKTEPVSNTSIVKTLSVEAKNNIKEKIEEKVQPNNIKVDIKGAVKKPGVYEVNSTSNVSDLIRLAGGLNKNATTSNINLSRVLENQMVVKIYTKNELQKSANKEISECVCKDVEITKCNDNSIIKIDGENKNVVVTQNSTENKEESTNNNDNKIETNNLISINTASKEELMTITGIGESKALAIIEYRNTNGSFKTIEDIKNVSGIGDSLYEKIKSYITI